MATPASVIIQVGPGRWQLVGLDGPNAESIDLPASGDRLDRQAAAGVADVLRRHGCRGRPAVLAVPSDWVLAASISTENLPRRNRRQGMLYRLEEQLPLPAEELAADFVERPGQALGVAVRTETLQGILLELESAGVVVELVAPMATLALQAMAQQAAGERTGYLAMGLDGQVELAALEAGRLRSWQSLKADPKTLLQALRADLVQHSLPDRPARLWQVGLDEPLRQALAGQGDLDLQPPGETSSTLLAARAAWELVSGRSRPWVDLRRGALAPADRLRTIRRPLQVMAALTVLALCLVTAGLLWRASRYGQAADRLRDQQEAIFWRLYPGRPAPGLIRWRLESDARRLGGMRGAAGTMPERVSALETLRQVAAGLPGNVRLQLAEVRLEPSGIILEGQTRTHADAELIALQLRKAGTFVVEPPRTEQLGKEGVSFTLTAKVQPPGGQVPP